MTPIRTLPALLLLFLASLLAPAASAAITQGRMFASWLKIAKRMHAASF